MSKMKNRFCKDNGAVSEVVGTILILSITIVLFSSIFATVSLMETPEQRTYIDFESSFVSVEDEISLTITHKGGHTLEKFNTAFNIVVYDGTYRSTRYAHNSVNVTFPDDLWGIGEVVVIDLGDLPERLDYNDWTHLLGQTDIAEILVMDTGRNDLIWRNVFRLREPGRRVIIKDMDVEYPHDWADYVEAGNSIRLYARIGPSDLVDDITVTVDIGKLLGYEDIGTVPMVRESGDRFVYPEEERMVIDSNQENGTYNLRLEAEYNGDEENVGNDNTNIILNVGPLGATLDQPFIRLDENKIYFNPISPVNGENVQIHAAVENSGGSPAVCNVTLYSNHTRDDEAVLIHTFENISLASGGGRDLFHSWEVQRSGVHNISLVATDIRWHGGEYTRPDPEAYKFLHVQPTILLVDDVRGEGNDATAMRGDLVSTESTFDHHIVDGTHRPSLEILQKYDIIIWMTGSQSTNTLTEEDKDNLREVMDNGTSLWLIGSNLMDDPDVGPHDPFITDYLKTSIAYGAPIVGNISGVDIPLDSTDVYEVVEASYCDHHIEPFDGDVAAWDDADNIIAVSYEDEDKGYRSMYNSFLFSSMEGMPGEEALPRSNMVYKVINWLGGVEFKGGNDVAVAEQKFSTATPMYMEWVNIDAVIRNNGMENLTDVEVRLQVNGQVLENNATTINNLEGMGGTHRVEFSWLADTVGRHEVLVVADPFNMIVETNKENNDIRYKGVNVHVTVRFSVLVVDDDHTGSNTTAYVTESLERLGYAYQVHDVEDETSQGPSVDEMNLFNSVYWVCGHSMFNTLLEDDIDAIESYLLETSGTSFLLIGNHVLEDLTTTPPDGDAFLQNFMGIDPGSVTQMTDFPERLKGTDNDPIGHGLEYTIDPRGEVNPYGFDVSDADIFLDDGNGNNAASRYYSGQFRTAFLGVDLFHLDGPVYGDEWYTDFEEDIDTSPEAVRQELIYMITKWFGNVDYRVELRVSSVDIEVENPRPMLGNSYLITATIHNVGHSEAFALIRIKDGYTLSGSKSISIPADGVSTAEITWKTLYAGPERPIRVLVDPLCNVEEIGNETAGDHMGFNNHAMIRLPVYYFWDDMENGTANWRTEATIMNINAEHPLEFLTEEHEKAYTDIIADWDWDYEDASKYLNVTSMFSYSDPRSYWLAEPALGEEVQEDIPIDVFLAIDTSGSMHWGEEDGWDDAPFANHPDSRMYQAVEAAVSFVDNMTSKDRVEIWTFHHDGGSNPPPYLYKELAYMTQDNRTDFIQALYDIREGNGVWSSGNSYPYWGPNGNTPYYDTLGSAVQRAVEIGEESEDQGKDRLEFVIGLADGQSNSDSMYSPHADWGDTTSQGGGSSGSGTYDGLLNAPPMVYNIGFITNALRQNGGTSSYPVAPNYDNEHDGIPSLEEEMFNVGNTSPGEWQEKYGNRTDDCEYGPPVEGDPYRGRYYFAEEGEDVLVVFEELRRIISAIAGREADAGNMTSMPGDVGIVSDGAGLMQTTETRYMRNDYVLGATQTGEDLQWGGSAGGFNTGYWGIRVWAGGQEITNGDAVAIVSRSVSQSGMQSATWTPPETNLDPSDTVEIRIYVGVSSPPTHLMVIFETEPLGTDRLESTEWTVHYWTQRSVNYDWNFGWRTYLYFRWGDLTHNSRIEEFTYATGDPPEITLTRPTGGETWYVGTEEEITWTTTQGDGVITGIDLDYSIDGGASWTNIVTGTADTGSYIWEVPNEPTTEARIRATVHDDEGLSGEDTSEDFIIEEATFIPPSVTLTRPTGGETWYVGTEEEIKWTTNQGDGIITGIDLFYSIDGGATWTNIVTGIGDTGSYIWEVPNEPTTEARIRATVHDDNGLSGSSTSGLFTISDDEPPDPDPGLPTGENYNKTAVTPSFDLTGYATARLTFWHKYNIVPGMNGAFLQVGFNHEGEWKWRYVIPTHGSYTGNMNMSAERRDDFDRRMDWAWNGVSGGGSFDWSHVQVNLLPYIDEFGGDRSDVRVRFNYTQYGSGTGYGWFFDDVKLVVTRAPGAEMTDNMKDVWRQVTTTGHDGEQTTAWWNGQGIYDEANPSWFLPGIDNSLVSSPIDLTNARTAFLEAYFKFNINTASGAPPDGFRVEVTVDGGRIWMPINSGVRTATGVYDWTRAEDLDRLNVDLSDFRGYVIRLRFRVFTCNAGTYNHYEDEDAGFGGFYVDNVIVSGRTVQEG